jgi:hypothetical protein
VQIEARGKETRSFFLFMALPSSSIIRGLLLLGGACGLGVGLVWYSVRFSEAEFRTPRPDEARIAQHILDLGGACHIDRANERHITGVWLTGTQATDRDVAVVMQLQLLEAAHFDGTRVTDACLPSIFAHSTLRRIRLKGAGVAGAGDGSAQSFRVADIA